MGFLMELFERVLFLEGTLGSKSAIARALGITPQRLVAYSNVVSQKNLWPLLPNILKTIPVLNREWLYFGEGEMLNEEMPSQAKTQQTKCPELSAMVKKQAETIRILTETNRKLTEELLRREKDEKDQRS